MKHTKTLFLTQFAILLAIEAVFCFTPLGSIPVGPIVATLAMIPVVIAACLLGVKAGALLGGFAGLFSFIVWTFMPPNPITAFAFTPAYPPGNFWSLVVCFVPRILAGLLAGLVATAKFPPKADVWRYVLSGVTCSLTNTVLVLGGIWLFFGGTYGQKLGNAMLYIIGLLVLTNGIPEAIVNAIVAPAVCKPLKRALAHIR